MGIKKRLSILLCTTLMFSLVLGTITPALAKSTREAVIETVKGEVNVTKAGGSKSYRAFEGMTLNQGDHIETGAGSKVVLRIKDHDDEITIDEKSSIYISELSEDTKGKKSKVKMWAGSLWGKVKTLVGTDDEFTVETPTAVMGVRGTNLLVGVDPETGESKFYIASGQGNVNKKGEEESGSGVTILPNQEISLDADVDAEDYADYANIADLDDLITNTSDGIIEAIILSKAAIDQENQLYISNLKAEQGASDGSNQETIDRLTQNLDNLVGNIVKNAINQNKVDEVGIKELIAKVNEQLDKKLDLDNVKAQELSEAEKSKQAQVKLLEEGRKKKQEAEKLKQEELKKQNVELQKKLKEQLEKQRAEKLQAEEAAKKKAVEEYAKKLADDAAKAAFAAKVKAVADEKAKQDATTKAAEDPVVPVVVVPENTTSTSAAAKLAAEKAATDAATAAASAAATALASATTASLQASAAATAASAKDVPAAQAAATAAQGAATAAATAAAAATTAAATATTEANKALAIGASSVATNAKAAASASASAATASATAAAASATAAAASAIQATVNPQVTMEIAQAGLYAPAEIRIYLEDFENLGVYGAQLHLTHSSNIFAHGWAEGADLGSEIFTESDPEFVHHLDDSHYSENSMTETLLVITKYDSTNISVVGKKLLISIKYHAAQTGTITLAKVIIVDKTGTKHEINFEVQTEDILFNMLG